MTNIYVFIQSNLLNFININIYPFYFYKLLPTLFSKRLLIKLDNLSSMSPCMFCSSICFYMVSFVVMKLKVYIFYTHIYKLQADNRIIMNASIISQYSAHIIAAISSSSQHLTIQATINKQLQHTPWLNAFQNICNMYVLTLPFIFYVFFVHFNIFLAIPKLKL